MGRLFSAREKTNVVVGMDILTDNVFYLRNYGKDNEVKTFLKNQPKYPVAKRKKNAHLKQR